MTIAGNFISISSITLYLNYNFREGWEFRITQFFAEKFWRAFKWGANRLNLTKIIKY